MLLGNMMEDKQLNFNQPLLSVRRFSSTMASTEVESKRKNDSSFSNIIPLPTYKSELKSGPVRNPGAVPFIWEQTPGRPKDESKPQTWGPEQPPTAPKLPPGRILNTKQRPPDKVSKDPIVAGTQTENILSNARSVPSLDENVSKLENFKEGVEDKGSSGSEDGDVAYLDALDTLSRSESFFLNCSVSGLSGLDGPNVKPSGTFSTDPQTRDFMMGRFLPAAKAMASETPPYASRRQPVAQAQPRQVKNVVSGDRRPPLNQYRPNVSSRFAQDKGRQESEDEDDYVETELLSAKVCGLFPRFGLKNSFCLMNPVLGMGVQSRVPASSLRAARARFSYGDASTITENKHSRNAVNEKISGGLQRSKLQELKREEENESNKINYKSDSRKPDGSSLYMRLQGSGSTITENKHSRNAVNEKRSGGLQRSKLQELKREEENESNKTNYKSDSWKPDGPSLYMRLQGGGILPYRSDSLLSHFNEEKGFHGTHEEPMSLGVDGFGSHQQGHKIFRELLASSPEQESGLESPTVEKTLYIDSVHIVEPRNSSSSCSDMKGLSDSRSDFEILGKSTTPSMEPSLKDIKHLSIADDEGKLQPKFLDSMDSSLLFSSVKSDQEVQMDQRKGFSRSDLILDSITLDSPEVLDNKNLDDENHQSSEADSLEKFHDSHSEFPLPPPLPKSPAESWLSRALPSVSSKISQSHFVTWTSPRNQASKTSSPDPKWETIVKASNVHKGHLRFSEKLLAPVPES